MMSMFSFFDAVCAETSGQKVVGYSPAPIKLEIEKESPVVNHKIEQAAMKKEEIDGGKSSPAADNNKKQQQRRRFARFAPELDGVHCFETIVPAY